MSVWPAGYARKFLDTVDSTNEEAKRLATSGEAGPLWIAAECQTAGRGRRGRDWISPSGNLCATLLLRPRKSASDCAQLSFVAALAVSDAIAAIAPNVQTRLKWPNDVLIAAQKVAGILLESAGNEAKPEWLAVGIGLNLAHHPAETEFPATSLAAWGVLANPPDALAYLAASFAKWYGHWIAEGFAPVRDGWLARAAGLGGRMRARLQNGEVLGVFEGLDAAGALILRETPDRVRTIAAGEVFFAR